MFSYLKFSDETNISKLVCDMWVNRLCHIPVLCNWIWMNMIFKSSRSKIFCKTGVLKPFVKLPRKHLRHVTILKKLQLSCFSYEFFKFVKNTFGRLLLDNFHWANRNQVFSFFERVLLLLHSIAMNIMNFAIKKQYFAKCTMKLHVKYLQLYWKKPFELIIIYRKLFDKVLANMYF